MLMEAFTSFFKIQRLQPLKFTYRKLSKGENEKSSPLDQGQSFPRSDMENLTHSLLDLFLVKATRDVCPNVVKIGVNDFSNDYLNKAAIFNSMDEIVTEVAHAALPKLIQEAQQELEQEEMLDGIILCVVEEEVKAIIQSVLNECLAEMFKPQQQEVAAFAAKQLIDIFLLERVIGKMSLQGPRFSGKEHSSMILDNLIFDILLRQFFSIQQQQRVSSENIPLGDFHLKAFTNVALDVILTELNKVADEDMEDLLEYETKAQCAVTIVPLHQERTEGQESLTEVEVRKRYPE
ncbi:uncharacterized protein LOC133368273 isoform X2 [Rhineura floridana]|uniref:uncharacterized protein LOC133368273 isoform X2 n=1 Tax=Rhineura floridana TaxID=261503 RepID=UPI002AC7FD88|nr:uncharacterized protein LOC133368273 isoform X2 [Rhineura floridana]